MPKSSKREQRPQQPEKHAAIQYHRRRQRIFVLSTLLCLLLGSVGYAGWRSFTNPSAPAPTTATNLSPASPTKEYIYAGGRLVATEEPAGSGGSSLTAPANLLASTVRANPSAQISLTWAASTGGTLSHYVIERRDKDNGVMTLPAQPTTNSYLDTAVTAGQAYLYRVRAVDTGNQYSDYSNPDLATAIVFEDDPLWPIDPLRPSPPATTVRAIHFTQLREAINAVRALAGKEATAWAEAITPSAPGVPGVPVRASHVTEMRTSLNEARAALSLAALSSSPPAPATGGDIRAAHITELRDGVK